MKVLITGAAGFLGKNVTRAFLEEGFDVTGFDLTPDPGGDVKWIQGDLVEAEGLVRAVAGQDVVIHLGAVGDVYLAAENPSLAARVNVVGSSNVAQAAWQADAKVVYASTWEVYGEPAYEPIDEDHPCDPDHPYNITKLAGERLLLSAGELHEFPVISLRLGTAYGSGLRANSVFRIFIDKAQRGEPIEIQGDGSQGRQFTHARDLASAFVTAARSSVHSVAFNTVDDEMITIRRLAEMVTDRFPTQLTFGDPRPGDIATARVSNRRITEELGWRPTITFDRGLKELMDDASASGPPRPA